MGKALVLGALLSLIGFLVLTVLVILHDFDGADRLARAVVQEPRHPLFRSSMEMASFLGGEPGQFVVVCFGSVLLWRRRGRWGLWLPMVMAGAGVLQLMAKWAIDRPRPNLDAWGFPSAHVLSLVVLFGYIAYVAGTSRARHPWRGLGVAACAVVVGTVAYSRMYLDAHWLSDVLGGFSIGLAYLLGALWLIRSTPALPAAAVRAMMPAGSEVDDLLDGVATGKSSAESLVAAATAGS